MDISGILTFPINSINKFNCFYAETSFNIIRTQDISCANEISCNDICCNDISCNFIKVIDEISCNTINCNSLENITTIIATDISCSNEISGNIISCNEISAIVLLEIYNL